MTRWILVALLVAAPMGQAFADPDIGCGPGTQIWEGSKGVAPKVMGSTTNGVIGLQSFGISFGTMGCNQGGMVTADARLRMFTGSNMDRLARDMAHGQGETLDTFAHLYGVSEGDRVAFNAFTRQHFAEIYGGDAVTEVEMLDSLDRLLTADPALAVYARS